MTDPLRHALSAALAYASSLRTADAAYDVTIEMRSDGRAEVVLTASRTGNGQVKRFYLDMAGQLVEEVRP